ncbi:MAG: tyrosine-type recombinase/integrase [Candidatus Cloacimonetes bacterium]|nr:tyrosine-type recombinase/integrase [Candidatus Cloacimonadota bacterium]
MNYVEPIRDTRKIKKIKKLMRNESKIKEVTIFEIGIKTGLRISDILKLKWNDVIMKNNEIQVRDSVTIKEKKTGKNKIFRLSEKVKESILELYNFKHHEINDFMFLSESNNSTKMKRPISRQYVWQLLNDFGYRAGIRKKIGTHTLRKTFGYHAYKNGVDLSLLIRIFNHSSQDITLRYIGITQDQMDDVYINMDKIL